MAMEHGVKTAKVETGVSAPIVAESGIIFAVGAAPAHMAGGKAGGVVRASNYREAVEQLGYSDDWENYGLSEVIYTAFRLYQVAPVYFVNVLDPAKHKKQGAGEYEIADSQVRLPLEAVAESVKIAGKEKGSDFEVFYDGEACVVEFLDGTSGAVTVSYDAIDPLKVTKADVIGGYDVATHKTSGLELIDGVFPKYGEAPDIILCPNWSQDAEVAAVMSAKAEAINGLFQAVAITDICTGGEGSVSYYTEAPAWKKSSGMVNANQIVCFPRLRLGDREFNYSSQLAALMAQTDRSEEYGGGSPCEAASGKALQADSMALADGTEVILDQQQANYLNDNGIVTALNLFNGFVSWGSWTACYPSSRDPVDYFYSISRMFRWVAKSVTLSYWSYIDRGMSSRLLDAILQGLNDWLNTLASEEKIVGGRVELNEDENSETALMQGKAKFHIYITPPSPLVHLEFVLEYDASYLAGLLSVS